MTNKSTMTSHIVNLGHAYVQNHLNFFHKIFTEKWQKKLTKKYFSFQHFYFYFYYHYYFASELERLVSLMENAFKRF